LHRYAEQIKDIVEKYHIIIIQPEEIDAALNDPNLNLNWLEALKAVEIINVLKPNRAVIDSPSNNLNAFKEFIVSHLKHKPKEVLCEHKADENHVSASAASILAKTTREDEVLKIKKELNLDFGSGYPSDPKTKAFVEKCHDKFPHIFRKTWQTYKNILKKEKQKGLSEY